MPRPFFRKRIEELEQMFRESIDSPELLKNIFEELQHRDRPRAVALRKKIEDVLKKDNASKNQIASVQAVIESKDSVSVQSSFAGSAPGWTESSPDPSGRETLFHCFRMRNDETKP